ncbi:MAG: presequence protease, mitochondrial [Chlamydiota bacterium]
MTLFETPGEEYRGFVVKRCLPISELNATLIELSHVASGAEVMHIECNDPENLFCLGFRTLPKSSNGVAHILEHTVLCGSQKFPVKDPFFAMTRRSLNTFMNALTGSDFTCYPAATQNEKDFYNLLDVYLDAVFHPELKKMSFLQEGHRLEFSSIHEMSTPLQHKGVVYNEMKGSLSSADTRLWHALMEALVPDLPYAYNSGGDPTVIPELTYEELLAFHRTYYHPSQCLFFFYGNFPLKKHLDTILDTTLQHATKKEALPPIKQQLRFRAPVCKELFYPVGPSEETEQRSFVSFAFLTAPIVDQETALALSLLDAVLMDNDGSLLKAELLKSGLCVSVDALMDTEMSEIPYAFVFKGCDPLNVERLETFLFNALSNIVLTGIPGDAIRAALHQLEFARLEITGDHAPFGLTLFFRAALAKQHGCPPENGLMVHTLFNTLISKLQDPHYLTDLIKKYFLENPHRVRIVMHPDANLPAKELDEEKRGLAEIQQRLSFQEKESIIKQSLELAKFQEHTEQQSLECLPNISLKDIDPQIRSFPLTYLKKENVSVYHHECFTNHICYADLFFDLPTIDQNDLPLAGLLFSLLPQIGSGNRDFAKNLQFIQSYVGGLSLSAPLYPQVDNLNQMKPAIHVRGKALRRNLNELFVIMKEMIESPRLDEKKRIEELVKKTKEHLLNQLNRKALRYASSLCFSGASQAGFIQENWLGLTYLEFIEKTVKERVEPLIERLIALKEKLFTFQNPTIVLSCDGETYNEILKNDLFGLCKLQPKGRNIPWNSDYTLPKISSQAYPISSQVAFMIQGLPSVPYLHPHSAPLMVACPLLDHLILHPKVREQGGAYGVGANYSASSAHFSFHSYRDPHIGSTLNAFKDSLKAITQGDFSLQDVEEAKIHLFQHIDSPVAPSSRALTTYTRLREGKTDAMRQKYRTELLNITPQAIQEAVLSLTEQTPTTVVFAGKSLIEEESPSYITLRNSL